MSHQAEDPVHPRWTEFHGANLAYALAAWERYRRDPSAVDAETAALLEALGPPPAEEATDIPAGGGASSPRAVAGAVGLAHAIRDYGHLEADLYPLSDEAPGDPALRAEAHGIQDSDLRGLPATLVAGACAQGAADAAEAIARLRKAYSGSIGHDHRQVRVPQERNWLAEVAESGCFAPGRAQDEMVREGRDWARAVLARLTQVEAFEQFMHRVFPGRHRFSIEGLDMLVPMLDEMVYQAAGAPTEALLVGMAHRGRLSVMAHVMQRPYRQILREFTDPMRAWRVGTRADLGWTGDVKYHHGAYQRVTGGQRPDLTVTLLPNPSHLEFVNPVVQGMARAAGTQVDRAGPPRFDPDRSVPVAIHGDAAFPAQGVVAETLNSSRIPGYRTGGTIHVIANNRIGFTTDPEEGRSTLFASDLAKGFRIPILHVNADDPEACIEATRMAWEYRARFRKDVVIDLIGYRRYGHNEGDEPRFTQPRLYAKVDDHPTVRQLWARRLRQAGWLDEGEAESWLEERFAELSTLLEGIDQASDEVSEEADAPSDGMAVDGSRAAGSAMAMGAHVVTQEDVSLDPPSTAVDLEALRALNQALLELPEGFELHPKLQKAREHRREALDDEHQPTIDWALAEELALASILADGIAVRLTGEDTERGTFSQRHAVLHEPRSGKQHVPLQALPQARAAFEVLNSPLSEVATVGFEYGYNVQAPERLVLWEAQYGDFMNVAQVMLDEFLLSGRAKWGQTPSLGLLLPHGYEGAGPNHSSARPERVLQLAADNNLRLAYPSTAAQYFHLLRLQAKSLENAPLPLIVLTPKSLLRAAIVRSTPLALSRGAWQSVIDDPRPAEDREAVRRLVLCAGKVWADLVGDDQWQPRGPVAVARVEQPYPVPEAALAELLQGYPSLSEVAWVQEEPANMGFWSFLRPRLEQLIDGRWPLRYIGRPRSSSPAEGISAWHQRNQRDLVRHALRLEADQEQDDLVSRATA